MEFIPGNLYPKCWQYVRFFKNLKKNSCYVDIYWSINKRGQKNVDYVFIISSVILSQNNNFICMCVKVQSFENFKNENDHEINMTSLKYFIFNIQRVTAMTFILSIHTRHSYCQSSCVIFITMSIHYDKKTLKLI